MKPVPIARYLDLIDNEQTEQRGGERRQASPFRARVIQGAEARNPPPSAQTAKANPIAARGADLKRKPVEWPVARAKQDGAGSSGAISADLEARVAEAYDRGYLEGSTAALAQANIENAKLRSEQLEEARSERLTIFESEQAKLNDAIASGLEQIEERIGASVSRILARYVEKKILDQIIAELLQTLHQVRAGDPGCLIVIRGPEHLLERLRAGMASQVLNAEYITDDSADVVIEAGHARIESQFQAWADVLELK